MAFPTSIPSNTDPTASNTQNSPDHAQLHQSHNAEIVAIETKIGTGASTPTSGKVLRATGTGTSAWGQTVLSTDIATATSADLRGILSDETGTGVAVFGTAPTLGSPAITTPNITTSINDSNGNEVIKTPATASAINEITITNAAIGNSPDISATGGDTNIGLTFTPKGTGVFQLPTGKTAGLVRQRQGGTTGDSSWITRGTSNTDTTAKAVFIQVGSSVLGTAHASVAITFPVAFAQIPWVLTGTSSANSVNDIYATVRDVTITGFNLYNNSSGNGNNESASWIAIGQ